VENHSFSTNTLISLLSSTPLEGDEELEQRWRHWIVS
jgi:hypothetical protein